MDILFPFVEYWNFYLGFLVFVVCLLALDLGVFHKNDHVISIKEALGWSVLWISLALLFNLAFYFYALDKFSTHPVLTTQPGFDPAANASRVSLEFLTGFLIEKSLSIDNLFVFVVIFTFFRIPAQYQHRVLFFGIIGALLFRALFIAAGSVLMKYHALVVFFGVLLMLTGIKLFFAPEKGPNLEKNWAWRFLKRFVPMTSTLHGKKFVVRENGRRVATPLLLALILVEVSDVIFAVDSVPAIFALTNEPLIVFTSNVFAILGLRSLYFLLAGMYERFHLLKYGLGVILVFVGLKMVWLNEAFGGKFPISWSLGFILSVLALSIGLSFRLSVDRSSRKLSSGR
ncbi:MAG: TerC family protein [Oligoflexia bacterium]|nr:TerC family protein [Oligoflexia bacterium]